jgi:hypothetical protein
MVPGLRSSLGKGFVGVPVRAYSRRRRRMSRASIEESVETIVVRGVGGSWDENISKPTATQICAR